MNFDWQRREYREDKVPLCKQGFRQIFIFTLNGIYYIKKSIPFSCFAFSPQGKEPNLS